MLAAPLQQVDRTCVLFGRRKLAYFAGCDYFRMASHPAVIHAFMDGQKYGLNVAASRFTTGNHILYVKLETALARFFAFPSAVLVDTGYVTNAIVAQALKGGVSGVLIDEKSHPSLQDAARFFDCPVFQFKHRSPDDLAVQLPKAGNAPILLTDGLFSKDGEIAPLKAYLKMLPKNGLILLDDAHGAGVLGRTGRGTPEFCGVERRRIIQTLALSKAFGVFGGAILCDKALRRKIIARSSMFAGSTPIPLPLANAALQSIKILASQPSIRKRLAQNTNYAKTILRKCGVVVPSTPAPIVSIFPKTAGEVKLLKKRLLDNEIFPTFIHYPGGPQNGYFRFVISSEHTRSQIDALLKSLNACD